MRVVHRRHAGDTLVEVMVAFAVFSMAAVAAVAIMNRGIAMAQRSLEITLVRSQVDAQANMLRYVRDSQPDTWAAIREKGKLQTSAHTDVRTSCPINGTELPTTAFFLRVPAGSSKVIMTDLHGGSVYQPAPVHSYTDNNRSYGLWIEPIVVSGSSAKAYDMYIMTCWDTVGSTVPMTVRTIVRLYET